MMRPQIWALVELLRASAVARWTTVRQLRSRTHAALGARRAGRRRGRGVAVASERLDTATDDWLETAVVRVIAHHPEGVRAIEIGNELGVDWRRVPAVARSLVERAVVEQVADEFYPAPKAS